MCGRYIPNTEAEVMEIRDILSQISLRLSRTQLNVNDDDNENSDVFPTQIAPIITYSNQTVCFEKAKWGFTKWDNKGSIINAKSETIETSRFFKPYTKNNRCIVPAHGYYEWETLQSKSKIKYTFTNNDVGGIFMAGIFKPGEDLKEFVILTKNANDNFEFIHNRMPLILKREQIKPWLTGELNIFELQKEIYDDINYQQAL